MSKLVLESITAITLTSCETKSQKHIMITVSDTTVSTLSPAETGHSYFLEPRDAVIRTLVIVSFNPPAYWSDTSLVTHEYFQEACDTLVIKALLVGLNDVSVGVDCCLSHYHHPFEKSQSIPIL